jgi:hypothetical protein
MKKHLLSISSKSGSLYVFFLLVFLFSIPFWVAGPVAGRLLPEELTANLPVSALMVCAPITAAVLLVRREKGAGAVKALLKEAFSFRRIKRKVWYIPIFLLIPAMMVLQYWLLSLMGLELANPQDPRVMYLKAKAYLAIGMEKEGRSMARQAADFNGLSFTWPLVRDEARELARS